MISAVLLMSLGQAFVFPQPRETLNIVQWEASELPKAYVRTAQPPLTDAELMKLAQAGFEPAQLVKLIEERRCACDASADGLIRLKGAGVTKEVMAAVSLHALKPNQAVNLAFTFDFIGEGTEARQGTFYAFVDDGPLTRVFSAPLGELMSRPALNKARVDQSDVMLPRTVRRVQLAGLVPLKTPGPHQVLVVSSANPSLTHPSQLVPAERAKARTYTFEYPRASVQSLCRLFTTYKRDAVLAHVWLHTDSRLECEWN